MLEVIRAQHALYQHVIDVYFHGSLEQSLKTLLTIRWNVPRILESKRYYLIAVDSAISGEGHLVFIRQVHLDLIIPGIGRS